MKNLLLYLATAAGLLLAATSADAFHRTRSVVKVKTVGVPVQTVALSHAYGFNAAFSYHSNSAFLLPRTVRTVRYGYGSVVGLGMSYGGCSQPTPTPAPTPAPVPPPQPLPPPSVQADPPPQCPQQQTVQLPQTGGYQQLVQLMRTYGIPTVQRFLIVNGYHNAARLLEVQHFNARRFRTKTVAFVPAQIVKQKTVTRGVGIRRVKTKTVTRVR